MLTGYGRMIIEATGCSATEVDAIEEIMRDIVFHSTLDWQTPEELKQGARTAYAIFQEMNERGGPATSTSPSTSGPIPGR
jgi:hypothetical protein